MCLKSAISANTIMNAMVFKRLIEDIDSYITRDPAARSRLEVILCYPGYHALVFYRMANWLWRHRLFLAGRFLSNIGKILSGIEIHPGATIGRRFFIDHGNGVVIGETAEIGDDVTLYQGVTLGGTSLNAGKRHPTLEDNVIVGSGAQVLGPITVRECARIGANAVVLKDVPSGATMVGIPARIVMSKGNDKADDFRAYGTPTEDLPDPVARSFDSMRAQMSALVERIEELEHELSDLKGEPLPVAGEDGDENEVSRTEAGSS